MKLIINGHEYEAANLERVTGTYALGLADRKRGPGLGLQSLARRLEEMSRLGYDDDDQVVVVGEQDAKTPEGAARIQGEAVLDSEPHLRALLAFLWVSRRLSGEPSLTWDEACDFPIVSLEIVNDDDESVEDVEPDFTSPGSGPGTVADVA